MNACTAARPAPLRCPTLSEIHEALLALLPRGRAWQSNEGGPRPDSVLSRFFLAMAEAFKFASDRLCDLRLEFWCATHRETHAEWMREYGLPDACDPFPDLCAKVAALGGARCEYFAAVAARAGWSIECLDEFERCGAVADCAVADCSQAAPRASSIKLVIRVDLVASPAHTPGRATPVTADCYVADLPVDCDPDPIAPLRCIMTRIIPAHVELEYEVIPAPTYLVFGEHRFFTSDHAYVVTDA